MKRLSFTQRVVTLAIFTLAFASIAQAQATRTWVSGVGDDVNPCSRTAPCKTYAGAISKTAKDGEISTLDPGGFGTVTITKSITINGGGGGQGYGSILSALAPQGVLVNITDPADVRKSVRLDWLNINGASTGTNGIRMIAGLVLHVENTLVDGMTTNGLEINMTAGAEIFVNNSTFRNCAGAGIRQTTTAGTLNGSYDNVRLTNNGNGIDTQAGTTNISDSVVSGNVNNGILGSGAIGSFVNANHNDVTGNGTGINASTAQATVRINNNNVQRNTTGINNAGVMETYQNNAVRGNTADAAGGALVNIATVGVGLR
jgi:hypothetical protein